MNNNAKKTLSAERTAAFTYIIISNNTRDFWREIGNLGIHKKRKSGISMEVVDYSGYVLYENNSVLSEWKNDYQQLFRLSSNESKLCKTTAGQKFCSIC